MNADIPLVDVRVGMYLFLADDPLLAAGPAFNLMCEPQRVVAVYRDQHPDERRIICEGGVVVRATGWHERGHRAISLEMTGPGEEIIIITFPDDRHLVAAINLPDPTPVQGSANASGRAPWSQAVQLVVDPDTRHAHDAKDLSAYRLPPLWRAASVIWALPIPSPWSGRPHFHLAVLEAIGGVVSPAPADIVAAETPLHEDISISIATLCWHNAVKTAVLGQSASDPVLQPVLRRLVSAFQSMEELRSAAALFVDRHLALSGADLDYIRSFVEARRILILGRGRSGHGSGEP